MALYSLNNISPSLPKGDFWISETAQIIGNVIIGNNTSIWFGAVIRGDNEPIVIGDNTNIQENTVIHVDKGADVNIGSGCTIGHKAIIHGCTIGNNTLVGMGTIILNNAYIGNNCLVGAGSLITEGKTFPDKTLIMGSPAKVKRNLTEEEIEQNKLSANHYIDNFKEFKNKLNKLN
jgi:carbonic anhydrase/acetyltransferase-like protein (isoleucine patch superfamily)